MLHARPRAWRRTAGSNTSRTIFGVGTCSPRTHRDQVERCTPTAARTASQSAPASPCAATANTLNSHPPMHTSATVAATATKKTKKSVAWRTHRVITHTAPHHMTNLTDVPGVNIRRLRTAKGLTYRALSAAITRTTGQDVHFTTVRRIERNEYWSHRDLPLIARALGVDLVELFLRPGTERPDLADLPPVGREKVRAYIADLRRAYHNARPLRPE